MHEIYVLDGDSQVGPFTPDEIRRAISENRLTLAHLGWHAECETWKPLAEILEPGQESEGIEVLKEGPGYVLTSKALRVREEIFPLEDVARATVEVEHTRRGRAIAATIVFGFLLVVALTLPHKPENPTQWTIWGISVIVVIFFLLRFAISAFRPSATFLAIHLMDGDDRILPMTQREAEHASKAIHEALASFHQSSEPMHDSSEASNKAQEADSDS